MVGSNLRMISKVLALITVATLYLFASGFRVSAQKDARQTDPILSRLVDLCANEHSEVGYWGQTDKIRFLGNSAGAPIQQPASLKAAASPEAAARGYLSVCGLFFGLSDQKSELQLSRQTQSEDGRSIVRFRQTYQGIPIFGAEMVIQLNSANNVLMVNGNMLPDIQVDPTPSVDAAAAQQTALALVAGKNALDSTALTASAAELWVYNPRLLQIEDGGTVLVWQTEVTPVEMMPIRDLVLVDAHSGMVVLDLSLIDTAMNRKTYTLNNTENVPGTLVCDETNPYCYGGDTSAVNAHVYAGDTYYFYMAYHGRDSIDNAGMDLISSVHFASGYCNAFWTGWQMVYGDGCWLVVDDVVAHEMTHGVTAYESALIYQNESGAINESLSDVWGEFVDLNNGKGTDTPEVRWYIGEEAGGGPFRYMQDPTLYSDPDRMGSPYYYHGEDDSGGVHTNSGVNNKAAFLITDGGTFNGYTVNGIGMTKTSRIYYEAQTNVLIASSDYADLYYALHQACVNLIGTNGIQATDCQEVRNATLATQMNANIPPNLAPSNDDFATPVWIGSLPYTLAQDTIGATTATDDPALQCGSGYGQRRHSVWYRYMPGVSGNLTFNTIGSNYDTVLAVWTGSRGSLVSVGCNNDIWKTNQSEVQFAATAGVPYFIEIASYQANAGNLTLHAYVTPFSSAITSQASYSAPTLNGVIAPGEWADAQSYLISNPMASANDVTLYVMNDSSHLYLAFDIPNDAVETGVWFDDNPLPSDGLWTNTVCGNPDGEGVIWTASSYNDYTEFIAGPLYCPWISPAPGVQGKLISSSGHAQSEVGIDFTSSALRAVPGDTIKMFLDVMIWQSSAFRILQMWPFVSAYNDTKKTDPAMFGQIILAVPDTTPPAVVSSLRADPSPTRAQSVDFVVTFSEGVSGVDTGDFSLLTKGVTGASVTAVTCPLRCTNKRTVTVDTGTGSGTLRLTVLDDDSIRDFVGNPLGGSGAGNGNFTDGETYKIDKTPPTVVSSLRASPNPTNAAFVDFRITFSEAVVGVGNSDFSLSTTGVSGASISSVIGSSATYTVTVATGSGDGMLHLNVLDDDTILDEAGNPLNDRYTDGETYTIVREYSLTIIAANGTVAKDPDASTYHEGDVVQLTATPISDWRFSHWSGDLVSSANPASVTIHGNTTVTANFTRLVYLPLVIR